MISLEYFILTPTLIRLRNSFNKWTSTFTLTKQGLDLLIAAMTTCNSFPTTLAITNKDSLTKNLGDRVEKAIYSK